MHDESTVFAGLTVIEATRSADSVLRGHRTLDRPLSSFK